VLNRRDFVEAAPALTGDPRLGLPPASPRRCGGREIEVFHLHPEHQRLVAHSGCPQLHRPAATGPAVKVSHLHSNHSASRRTHDVRHSYATLGRDAKIDWKALSQRIGHADVAFTMKQYVQTDLEADRQVANTLAELIIGGSLASTPVASLANPLANHMQKAPSLFEKGPLALVAGAGFEPATSGL